MSSTDEPDNNIEPMEPIDPELARMLKSGVPALVAPLGASERLLSKLAISIPGLGGGPGGGGGGGGVATGAAAPAAATKVIALLAAAVAIGGVAVGVAASSSRAPSPTAPIASTTTATVAAPSIVSSASVIASSDVPTVSIDSLPSAAIEKRARPSASASASALASASASAPTSAGDVVEERRLVDGARAALARGDAAAAMTIIDDHEKRFSSGVLVEEREAIAIRSLVAQKRTTEAETRAARFRSAHPKSLFLPSVDAALAKDH